MNREQIGLAATVAGLFSLLPLAFVQWPPLIDYLPHLARVLVEHSLLTDGRFADRFMWNLRVVPNLGLDAIILPLTLLGVPLAWAGKLFVALVILLNGAAVTILHRAIRPPVACPANCPRLQLHRAADLRLSHLRIFCRSRPNRLRRLSTRPRGGFDRALARFCRRLCSCPVLCPPTGSPGPPRPDRCERRLLSLDRPCSHAPRLALPAATRPPRPSGAHRSCRLHWHANPICPARSRARLRQQHWRGRHQFSRLS